MYADPSGNVAWFLVAGLIIWIGGDLLSGAAQQRANKMLNDPSFYNIANWATYGIVGMGKGAFFPEKPLSLQHWLDSFGTASLMLGAYRFTAKTFGGTTGKTITIAGKGNTGRVLPNNTKEAKAMSKVLSDPLNGAKQLSLTLKDTRWAAKDGWVKMARNIDGIEIHYNYNTITKVFDDFKFAGK